MKRALIAALALGAALAPSAAVAQAAPTFSEAIAGTRLDISATGETTRVPDVATVSAGVVTRAATARAALQQNAAQMDRVRDALKKAGIADRDIQTSNISLNPEYRYAENQPPRLTGYTASNQVNVRFRDIAATGDILDALVAVGANQINGPSLTIDKPEEALDEARTKALAAGRARAELYARTLGMRVVRLLAVSESGGNYPVPPPMPVMMEARAQSASTKIDPGEQKVQLSLAMTFELR
ncbi:SIMPL domain-containing protein [Sphingomonas hankyongi]|uniref:SIMPL domain-containing protein n=1 Tax=Sphingomonas hankyongi TaxID=2908209 RepID=A0ABT0RZP0_9SPHN|nr:SIMPL domain-containing protein [Sphingomonas hankyongi]MCL6729012.1 SIMPL domain-containing protein [Sphingomonas hankyongi]